MTRLANFGYLKPLKEALTTWTGLWGAEEGVVEVDGFDTEEKEGVYTESRVTFREAGVYGMGGGARGADKGAGAGVVGGGPGVALKKLLMERWPALVTCFFWGAILTILSILPMSVYNQLSRRLHQTHKQPTNPC